MPTENRRVATYLPKYIDDRLEAFKIDRGLKGDSPALVAILEEYFGVSQEVAQVSITPLGQRVDALEGKVNDLVSLLTQRLQELSEAMESTQIETAPLQQLEEGSLGELRSELLETLSFSKAQLKSELLSELNSELPKSEQFSPPGQLSFLEIEGESSNEFMDELPKPDLSLPSDSKVYQSPKFSELPNELEGELPPMTEAALAERFGLANPKSLGNRRTNAKDDFQAFIKWSIGKDPEGKGWLYDPNIKLYCRVTQDASSESEDF